MPQYSVSELAPTPKANLLILHGLAEYSRRYQSIAVELASRGISTFAFDQRGHGARRPKTHVATFELFVDEALASVSQLREQHAVAPLFVWGHSMGSAVALLLALHEPDISGLVLTSTSLDVFKHRTNPLNPFFRALSRIAPRLRIPLLLNPQGISHDPQVQRQYAEDPLIPGSASLRLLVEFAAACRRIDAAAPHIRMPALIVHGQADRIAPVSGSQRLYERLGSVDKQLRVFPELRHEVHNEREPERSAFVDLIANWLIARADAAARK